MILIAYLEVRVFQCLGGGDALVGVDGEHLRDEVLRFCADVQPVLVVEAVDSLLDLRKQSRLQHTQGIRHKVQHTEYYKSVQVRARAIARVPCCQSKVRQRAWTME